MRNEAKEKPGAEPGPKPAADGGTDQEAGRGAGRSGAGAGAAGPDGERAAGPDDGRTAGTDDDRADRTDAEAEYRELVQLAYFVLPGKGKRIYRLALARRIVESMAVRAGSGSPTCCCTWRGCLGTRCATSSPNSASPAPGR
jgi:hypothetical protein